MRELGVPISRYRDPSIPSGNLTTSVVSVTTDAQIDGEPVIGYGFSSIGRFAQSGLIRERFAPRLLQAPDFADPREAWKAMMQGEKPGGHGERCVAVGTLDMAVWDAAAKIARLPVHGYLARAAGLTSNQDVAVYAGGGYVYPQDDITRLQDELRAMLALGFTRAKIKIGSLPLAQDLTRIEAALDVLGSPQNLAVDAMNAYGRDDALRAAEALEPYDLRWFEDICDPLDFETQSAVAARYAPPVAAGEALFSVAEALLLDAHGGLRRERDILLFDPVHCYGLTGYMQIVDALLQRGWPRSAFWPHGGHAFTLHVAAGLRLGGAECNPSSFAPFGSAARSLDQTNVFVGEELQTALQRCPPVSS